MGTLTVVEQICACPRPETVQTANHKNTSGQKERKGRGKKQAQEKAKEEQGRKEEKGARKANVLYNPTAHDRGHAPKPLAQVETDGPSPLWHFHKNRKRKPGTEATNAAIAYAGESSPLLQENLPALHIINKLQEHTELIRVQSEQFQILHRPNALAWLFPDHLSTREKGAKARAAVEISLVKCSPLLV